MTSGLDSVFTPVPVSVSGDGFHVPDISDSLPPAFTLEGTVLGMDRMMVIRLVMYLVSVLCLVLYAIQIKLVPGRVQILMETGSDFYHKNISEGIIGQELGHEYSPIITTIFFTVLFMNITGIIPGFDLAGTAKPGFPLLLTVSSWFMLVYAGTREAGLGHFVKSSLLPPGVPWVLCILLAPVEPVSTSIIRPFTPLIRLSTSMITEHFLLALTLSASNYFLFAYLSILSPLGILTLAATFALTLFGILVALLQVCIFAVLTAIYMNLSVHAH